MDFSEVNKFIWKINKVKLLIVLLAPRRRGIWKSKVLLDQLVGVVNA